MRKANITHVKYRRRGQKSRRSAKNGGFFRRPSLRQHFGSEIGLDLNEIDHQRTARFFGAGGVGQSQHDLLGLRHENDPVQIGPAEFAVLAVAVIFPPVDVKPLRPDARPGRIDHGVDAVTARIEHLVRRIVIAADHELQHVGLAGDKIDHFLAQDIGPFGALDHDHRGVAVVNAALRRRGLAPAALHQIAVILDRILTDRAGFGGQRLPGGEIAEEIAIFQDARN
ncbi:hypothetical protein SDC9_93657 [bioreactor metagenome]|uniref:Uncharacterized protein n=1 Tax=bioreactor metagenome TaxID=1076179 RepID=A0A645A178_9ZZZZ